uniref:Uncharacterized protein n=1 Tax=Vespula pensylvanica TaxID=30213 RepID=A0A834KCP1_VESPE|nr:hypothetical protein H0235_014951 [Vespula pensylvanica]
MEDPKMVERAFAPSGSTSCETRIQRRNEDDLLPLPLPSTMRTHCKDPVCREGCCLPLPMPMLTDDVSLQEEGKILRVETIFTSSGRDEGRVAARVFI